jgi:predicted signal transduction protein with EAL and GGDEF domain
VRQLRHLRGHRCAVTAQVSAGSYVAGQPLDLGWMLARVLLVAAAWTSLLRGQGRRPVQLEGVAVLVVPGCCALLVLGLLFHGTAVPLPRAAAVLALLAGLAAVTRTALTFGEVRDLAEVRRQARTDELTGLANRRRFSEVLERMCGGTQRTPFAVLLVDLDRFKKSTTRWGTTPATPCCARSGSA